MSRHHKSTRNLRKVSARFREECETETQPDGTTGRPCWLCGAPIDYMLPSGQGLDDAFERDHYFPVSTHPHLAEDPANFRASHGGCNRERGNNAPHPSLGILSQVW